MGLAEYWVATLVGCKHTWWRHINKMGSLLAVCRHVLRLLLLLLLLFLVVNLAPQLPSRRCNTIISPL